MAKDLKILETFREKDEHYIDITKTALKIFFNDNPTLIFNGQHILGEKPELLSFRLKTIRFYNSQISRITQLFINLIKYRRSNQVYLSTYPIFNFLTVIFHKLLSGNIYLIIHGELSVFSKKKLKLRSRLNYIIQKKTYKLVSKTNNIYICFLHSGITSSLNKHLALGPSKNLLSLEWPIQKIKFHRQNQGTKIKLGLFGTLARTKNSHFINILESELGSVNFEFKVVGRNHDIEFNPNIKTIHPKKGEFQVNQKEFFNELRSCDFLFSFSNYEDYELIYSGTVNTALKYSIPLLTLPNSTYRKYSELVGPFGIEFENLEYLAGYLKTNRHQLRSISNSLSEILNEFDSAKSITLTRDLFKFK